MEMDFIKNLLRFKELPNVFTVEIIRNQFKLIRKPIGIKNTFLKLEFIDNVGGRGTSRDPLLFKLTERAWKIINTKHNSMLTNM